MASNELGFRQSIAVVIGIDDYQGGIPPLRSAVADAERLAALLREDHGYHVHLLCNADASLEALDELFGAILPEALGPDDRLLIYFAGHGVALDGDDGPAGYLVPHGATIERRESFLPMQLLHQQLGELPCRHLLLILDCCFAGAFRWSATRSLWTGPQPIYQERFQRFVRDSAWQVLTSAAYDQEALDVSRFGARGDDGAHSPFARALFEALGGAADRLVRPKGCPPEGDGVITATELYCYLRDCVEVEAGGHPQTPGIWQLQKHDKGEFIFFPPGKRLNLAPAPELTLDSNPYRGLEPFDEQHKDLFFGRATLVNTLRMIASFQVLTVVTGSSGSGKSSLVKAGLLPQLREDETQPWAILPPLRPGATPLDLLASIALPEGATLAERVGRWREQHPGQRLLLLLDQFEELVTLCRDDQQREQFLQQLAAALDAHGAQLRMLITVRSDFEPQFSASALREHWARARFVIPPMTQDDLREAIKGPANVRVLYFEPEELVDRIINEVVQMPGALPLLSFTLSELYIKYLERRSNNRALLEEDYEQLGGVAGALRNRANEEFDKLDAVHQATMRRVMLRMVSLEGGGAARRRVLRDELDYLDPAENERVERVIRRLSEARLVVEGREEQGEAYVEPAHDALVRGWDRLWEWIRAEYETLPLQRRLTEASRDWQAAGHRTGLLWDGDPRLEQLEQVRLRADGWLNRLEHDFIKRSGKHRRRIRRFRLSALAAFIFMLTSLSGVAWQQRGEAVSAAEGWEQEAYVRATAEANALQKEAEAQSARGTAVAEQARAEQERDRAEQQTLLALSRELAAEANAQYDFNYSLGLLLGVASGQITETLEAQEVVRNGLRASPPLRAFLHVPDEGTSVTFSPDGAELRVLDSYGGLLRWDVTTAQPIASAPRADQALSALTAVSRDGRSGVSYDGTNFTLWDLDTGTAGLLLPLPEAGFLRAMAMSADGALVAGATDQGRVLVWDAQTGQQIGARETASEFQDEGDGAGASVASLIFDRQGRQLAVLFDTGLFSIWDPRSPELRDSPLPNLTRRERGAAHDFEQTTSLAFSPSGALTALGKQDGSLMLFTSDGQPSGPTLHLHNRQVSSIAFSPDGALLASGDIAGTVVFVDLAGFDQGVVKGRGLRPRGQPNRGHPAGSRVWDIAWSPDGRTVATIGGFDAILWDMGQNVPDEGPVARHAADAKVAWSPDSNLLASAGSDGRLLLWAPQGGQPVERATLSADVLAQLSFSPDGALLAGITVDGSLLLWDASSSAPARTFSSAEAGQVTALAWGAAGTRLAAGYADGSISIWDPASGSLLQGLPSVHEGQVTALDFDQAGERLVVGGLDGHVVFWDLATGETLFVLEAPGETNAAPGESNAIMGLALNDQDELLLVATERGLVFVGEVAREQFRPGAIAYHSAAIAELVPSPDRRRFVTRGADDLIVVWSAETIQPVQQLLAPDTLSVAFSPDGQTLVSGHVDGTVGLWEVPELSWEERACQVANRQISEGEWEVFFADEPYHAICE